MQNQAPEQSAAALAQLTASQPEVSHGGGILGDRSSAHINIRNLRVCILTLQGGESPRAVLLLPFYPTQPQPPALLQRNSRRSLTQQQYAKIRQCRLVLNLVFSTETSGRANSNQHHATNTRCCTQHAYRLCWPSDQPDSGCCHTTSTAQ